MTSDNDLRQAAHINARSFAAADEITRLKAEVERLTQTSAAAKENRDGLLKAMIDKDAEITRLKEEVERKDAALLVARDCIEESFSHAKTPDDMLMAEARLRDIDAALTPSQEPRT